MTNSSASSSTGAAELFHMLESNKLRDVEEIKKVFHDHFLSTKDNWLVNGLFDYYLSTDSLRAVEVLAGVREPHDKHLFDKLTDTLAAKLTNNGQKIRTLTLLGHVARRQPTWLYKLASHTLFKQLLHLLKVEEELVLLMSALFLLITLLPMLPTALAPHLNEIFEVFSRLASFHYHRFLSNSSANYTITSMMPLNFISGDDAEQLYTLHSQVGLHNLFHRLYAMYPCNFIYFLKQQYHRDQVPIFKKVISPMLDSVRMHPLLVTMSKDSEISSSRWKKMEHHDVVAECSRFSLFDRVNREDGVSLANMRFTPISEYSCPYTPISTNSIVVESTGLFNGSQENFWSPSMIMSAHSPPPPNSLQATPISQYDPKSTPSTPGASGHANVSTGSGGTNTGNRSRTSPPEAAVEATPETTPVKDLRQLSSRQLPVSSAAVRALTGFGNGPGLLNSSRPATPTFPNHQHQQSQHHPLPFSLGSSEGSSILDRKLGKIAADRQNAAAMRQEQVVTPAPPSSLIQDDVKRSLTTTPVLNDMLNGRIDAWQQQSQLEDQEVSDIVSSTRSTSFSDRDRHAINDLSRKVRTKFFCCNPTPPVPTSQVQRRAKSCPDIVVIAKSTEASTQTCDVLPYECFFLDTYDRKMQQQQQIDTPLVTSGIYASSRLSPSAMLERYIDVCAHNTNYSDGKHRSVKVTWQGTRRKGDDESENGQQTNDDIETSTEADRFHQQIQLLHMQLQFERHRREVHAERNRRLLGKLRDSRALEELNSAMKNRLKLAENEIESLKSELCISKMEARTAEKKLIEAVHNCQIKCKEEQQRNAVLKDQIEILEEELKSEKKKVMEHEKQTRAAEATLFEAAHQLKEALRAANQSEELKRTLDAVQKRFLLLGEAQARIQEKMGAPVHMARQEIGQIQRSWSEEVSNLRRQLDTQTLQTDTLKSRLAEFEHKDARKEVQLVEQQRLLQESKEKHSAELEAVESKYKAQLQINLFLEGRILELYGKLEQQATTLGSTSGSSGGLNLASSVSPKERSPPLSASLASSSEGSLAFIHSAINDCSGEISNLQAIVEPVFPVSAVASTSAGTRSQKTP